MGPKAPPTNKLYFYYGHRKPTQNRPTVHGGLFTNRTTINPNKPPISTGPTTFNLDNWDPDSPQLVQPITDPSAHFFSVAQSLSPIARYIVDSFRKHGRWGPQVVSDLNKLRRVSPKLVAEVLKVQDDPRLSSKFFHWAGKQKGYKHDFACYNALAYCLNRNNQFRAADQVPELMNMQGKEPTEKQFEILIRMHADANRGLRVYYVYEKMKKFGVRPRIFLYNRVLDALVKTNHVDLAMTVYADFRDEGLVEESITYMILIKGLCKEGRMDEVFELLNQMREKLCKPDVFAYTALVRLLVSEGNLDGCLRIWEEMLNDKVQPDVMAYSTLILGLCKGNRVLKGYELFKEMKEKKYLIDRVIYGSLIEAFVVEGKIGLACDLLKDLIDSGYRADLAIYNSLIKGLCCANHIEKAYRLFQVTVQEDLQPDFVTVNPMLVSYAESRNMDDFCKLVGEVQKLGFNIIDDLCRFFSYMVEKEDRVMTAVEVFDYIKLKEYTSVSIYNIIMEALYHIGEVDRALILFQELKNSHFEPDLSSYNNGIKCFTEKGDIQEACSCYNMIKEMSLVPSVEAYYSLVKGLCKTGDIDEAMMLIRDCLANVTSGPMEFKYSLAILHVCKKNDAEKIIEVLGEMMQKGTLLDEVVYSAIVCGMCKRGTIDEAKKVFTYLRDCKLLTEADLIVYDEILIDHTKKKTADLMLSGLKFFGLESKLKSKGCNLLPT
ncbi:pentatricopeptide repeat-containing protein At4g20740 [Apium graveolens]|uniref:pentatricopeptide repeat-containing protein At4g20740 n=1 Tax=Apium graveolens TaxID=4045 RepID=UPI003D7994D6